MNSVYRDIRRKIKNISSVNYFNTILDNTMLSEDEKTLLILHYKEQKTLCFIADEIGVSESTIKRMHKRVLEKISEII